jgi:hypothetical protein
MALLETADPFEAAAELLSPTPHPYANRSADWVNDHLGEYVTLDQRAIHDSVRDNRYTAVASCHDVGKSHVASEIVAHWIETHPSGQAFAVTTAPTDPQVKMILWRYIGAVWRKGKLKGRITLDAQWKLAHTEGPDEPVAYGRKPADYDPAGFQGIHSRYVLVVIDEACGVVKTIYDAVDSLATNAYARVLAIGNPDDPASHFRTICKPGSGWNVIHLDALRSPNFNKEQLRNYPDVRALMIEEGIPPSTEPCPDDVRDLLVSPEWVNERIKRWGIGSPLWDSKVRGKFPNISDDALIEPGWVLAAQNRELVPDDMDAAYGVDVARFGMDKTVIMLREGGVVRCVFEGAKTSVTETAGQVQRLGNAHRTRPRAQVDDVGVGGGVTDILRQDEYATIALVGGGACTNLLPNGKPKFVNLRSEWYWTVREAFQWGWIDIDPDDEDLAAQLTGIKYSINRHGQIAVESKDDMKKRKMPSPDRADALVYSWVYGGEGSAYVEVPPETHRGGSITGDLLTSEW